MIFKSTDIPEVLTIEPEVFGDERGFLMEAYRQNQFAEAGMRDPFVQENHTASQKNVLRGLHYQTRRPQGKLVRTIVGEIFDVAVDIRQNSSTFGRWVGVILSAQNHLQLWVPKGFAHGFFVLSGWAEVIYKTTDYYAPEWERVLMWNDPALGIGWPLSDGQAPILSGRDSKGYFLNEAELFDGEAAG